MDRKYKVAVVGATGAVGEIMLSVLAERKFPVGELVALASERSAGGDTSKQYAPKFAAAGAVVIDNSSAFRRDDDVPLVVTEVNPEAIVRRPRGIIANPNCSTMQMLVALAPIHRKAGIERINVATYQSVSGTGRRALEELGRQTAGLLNFQPVEAEVYPVQIAFNVIPHGGDFTDNGYTSEEMKLVWETRKILGDESVRVNATVVRVPVFYGHSEAVNVETREHLSAAEARALLLQAPGVEVVDEPVAGGYPTPVTHASGTDAVYVGRIRDDLSHPNGLNLWIVSDNIRKGAALNAVQIAERLVAEHQANAA
jgi:aspartate-semialdehyde dehydrogenase